MSTQHAEDHADGEAESDDCGCPPPGQDSDCDPELIDGVACRAEGVAAQAVYDATYSPQLAQAKTDYDTTRKDYRTKRQEAMLGVQDMRHQVKHLVERVRCLIAQKRVWRCLDDAYAQIVEELKTCEPAGGCCVGDCEYPIDDLPELDYDALVLRIAAYQKQTDQAHACFTDLLGEPAALTARVAAAKAALDAINAALGDDPAVTDLKRVYVQGLVVQRDIGRIWGGFAESSDFADCLCEALTCWTKGCAAVSALTGARAVAECRRRAVAAHCELLRTETVDEIMAAYDRLCPRETGGGSDCHHPGHGDHGHDPHDHPDDDHVDEEEEQDNSCGGDSDDGDSDDGDSGDGDEMHHCEHCGHHHRPKKKRNRCRCGCGCEESREAD